MENSSFNYEITRQGISCNKKLKFLLQVHMILNFNEQHKESWNIADFHSEKNKTTRKTFFTNQIDRNLLSKALNHLK